MSTTTITAQMVNDLRVATGAGLLDCKKALTEANGNVEEATTILRKKGAASAAKKADRATKEGLIESYIHVGGKVGVLIEVNCETDFVARNEDFKAFVKDLCLQIAAANPTVVSRDEVPEADLAKVTRQVRAIIEAIKEGIRTPGMKEELLELEARKAAEEALENRTGDIDYAKAQAELAEAIAQIQALRKFRTKK
jgi:translation elongation factor Ts